MARKPAGLRRSTCCDAVAVMPDAYPRDAGVGDGLSAFRHRPVTARPAGYARHVGETIVITGASSGIGRATVRRFAGPGVRMGLIARGRDGLEGARREVEAAGGQALCLPL